MIAVKLLFALLIAVLHLNAILAQEGYVPGFIIDSCPIDDNYPCEEIKTECISDCECPKQQVCCYQPSCDKSVCMNPRNVLEAPSTCGADIRPGPKSGVCPTLSEIDCPEKCEDECTNDCECPGIKKCCQQPKCANRCVDPETSPGGPTDMKNAVGATDALRCAQPCEFNSDCDLDSGLKCCDSGGCGFICMIPEVDESYTNPRVCKSS